MSDTPTPFSPLDTHRPPPMIFRRQRFSLVPILIIANLGVYALWSAARTDTQLDYMATHFLISWHALNEGRYYTLISSVFSHQSFWHFLINMFVLNSFGRIVEAVLSRLQFLFFYFTAAVMSSLGHALVSRFIVGDPDIPALGASGAIAGIVLLFSLIFPKEKIAIFGVIPMPAIFGAFIFIGLDIWGLIAQAGGGGLPIGHGAHLGGAFFGIIFYFFYLRGHLRNSKNMSRTIREI